MYLRPYISRYYLSLLLFFFITPALNAQWKISLKNKLHQKFNTYLFLEYTASSDRTAHFFVDLRFRFKDSRNTFMKKEFKLSTNKSEIFVIKLKLPNGDYEVDGYIQDLDINEFVRVIPDGIYTVNKKNSIAVSDIYLSYENDVAQAFSQPVMDKIIRQGEDVLYYFMEVEAPGYNTLTARAVLFKEYPENSTTRTEAYSSLNQTSRVIHTDSNRITIFKDTLKLNNLQEGEYLLEVRIFDEELALKTEEIRFEIGGGIKSKIFGDLENAMRMMAYTMPVAIIEENLSSSAAEDPDKAYVNEVVFIGLWKKLYGESYEEEMEKYYQRVFDSNRKFNEGVSIEGWQTDRGRIFIQYGKPGKSLTMTLEGKEYIKWIYPKWSLVFLFEKRNKRYILVE
ncbi:MAG: GWxTD domain-containing protein [Bacteroidetes bacterium]|nr:GWxTD domain-containing protein [Bacteroidota bacterium]MCB0842075.1 GWxTD domain-containing protein [Bacteroidota bacterium]